MIPLEASEKNQNLIGRSMNQKSSFQAGSYFTGRCLLSKYFRLTWRTGTETVTFNSSVFFNGLSVDARWENIRVFFD